MSKRRELHDLDLKNNSATPRCGRCGVVQDRNLNITIFCKGKL